MEPPGLGDSDPPRSSPPDLDELAGSVIDAFDVVLGTDGAAHLVGFSFGGIIAGRAAVRLGARAASLTLSGSGALGLPRPRLPAAMPVTPDLSPGRLRAALEHNLAGFMLGPARIDELALSLELESVHRSRLNYVPILRSSALLESLQIAECALAGIWGANDPFAGGGVEGYRECFDRLRPGGRFEVVEGASHWVMYDRPEAYCASLESILDGYRR